MKNRILAAAIAAICLAALPKNARAVDSCQVYSSSAALPTFATGQWIQIPCNANGELFVQQGAGISSSSWSVVLAPPPSASNAISAARIQSAATTNSTNIKASLGNIYHVDAGNNGATDAWLKFYNKATAPTCGTDTPIWTMYLPKGTARSVTLDIGEPFPAGIGYCITGAAVDSDTTAVAVNQVTGTIGWK